MLLIKIIFISFFLIISILHLQSLITFIELLM